MKVYKPFDGSTIHGFGIVRDVVDGEHPKYKKVFENETGKVFFDNFGDRQIKDLLEVKELTNENI